MSNVVKLLTRSITVFFIAYASAVFSTEVTEQWEADVIGINPNPLAASAPSIIRWSVTYDDSSHYYYIFDDSLDSIALSNDDVLALCAYTLEHTCPKHGYNKDKSVLQRYTFVSNAVFNFSGGFEVLDVPGSTPDPATQDSNMTVYAVTSDGPTMEVFRDQVLFQSLADGSGQAAYIYKGKENKGEVKMVRMTFKNARQVTKQ